MPSAHPQIVNSFIRSEELLLLVPKNHRLAYEHIPGEPYRTLSVNDVKDDSFILQTPEQRTRILTDGVFRAAGFSPKVLLTCRSISASLQIASKGLGLCFAAECFIADNPAAKNLCCYAIESEAPTKVELCAAHHTGLCMNDCYQYFLSLCRELL